MLTKFLKWIRFIELRKIDIKCFLCGKEASVELETAPKDAYALTNIAAKKINWLNLRYLAGELACDTCLKHFEKCLVTNRYGFKEMQLLPKIDAFKKEIVSLTDLRDWVVRQNITENKNESGK